MTPGTSTASPCGLGVVESAILRRLLELGHHPKGDSRSVLEDDLIKSSIFLDAVNTATDIRPAFIWQAILSLSNWWEVSSPLLQFHGNSGTPWDPPADPRYTEVALSALGQKVAEAESGAIAPLPAGLLIGDFCLGGHQPGFHTGSLVSALLALHRDPSIGDSELFELVGQPFFGIAGSIDGPIDRMLVGEPVDLHLTATVNVTGPRSIEITNIPCPEQTTSYPEEPQRHLSRVRGIRAIRDVSMSDDYRWEIDTLNANDPEDVASRIRQQWGMRIQVEARLPKPWRTMATDWLRAFPDDVDLDNHLDVLTFG